MSNANTTSSSVYVACVPHVPLIAMQGREVNRAMWDAYEARVQEFRAFDPELVIVFGGDHYDGMHLKLMPTFVVGQIATGLADCGGYDGPLNIPRELAYRCAEALVEDGFDIATSYAMEVDHGFTNVIHNFVGSLSDRPILPIHINAMCEPKPTYRRCRQLGEAVGRFAGTLGKRVALLGSGGLSHQTDFIFPQYDTAPNEDVRDFIVHGGAKGAITREKWMQDIQTGMDGLSNDLVQEKFQAPWINKQWDEAFLELFGSGDLTRFDAWKEKDVRDAAGYGGGEVRQWIAAAAAAQAMGVDKMSVDFYSDMTKLAVGVGIAHGSSRAA